MKKNLYNSVDTIWYLAGDNSTDFSYYTKRIILALIYANALFVLYNKDFNEVELTQAFSQVKVNGTLDMLLNLSEDWVTSSIERAKLLYKIFG